MTLYFYFARKFLLTFLGLFAGFMVFMWLIELLEHIRRFDTAETGFGTLAFMALLHLPAALYQIVTLVVLLATVMMFISLARTSELVITRATGRSAIRSLIAPALTAFLLGSVIVAVGNPMVAAIAQKYRNEENKVRGDDRSVSVSREGLWLRQGSDDRQTAIHALGANLDGTHLYNVDFFGFSPDTTPLFRIRAREAELTDGAWALSDAKRWDFSDTTNPEAAAEYAPAMMVPTELTSDQIRDSFGTPSGISIWALPAFIAQLEAAGFSARSHRVWFQSELAKPLSFVAMVLVGAIFTLRHTRFGRTGLMVLLAVLSGFAVFFTGSLAMVMADSGQVPVAIAVWAPPIAAILLALSLLLHFEDG